MLDDVPLGFGVSLHRFKLLQGFSRSSHNKSDSQSKLIPGPMFFVSTVSVTGENLKLSIFTLINTEHTDSTVCRISPETFCTPSCTIISIVMVINIILMVATNDCCSRHSNYNYVCTFLHYNIQRGFLNLGTITSLQSV